MRTYSVLLAALLLASGGLRAQTPTYAEDVAPIIFKNCVSCHRDGEIAPFPMTTYEETVRHASTIKSRVIEGIMPPWKPAQDYGHFVGERRLSDAQKKTITDWVDAGTPQGDISKMPSLPKFPQGSQLGTPDLVLRLPVKWQVLGNNKDVYRNFVVPTGLLEDKTIAAIEVRPDNRRVVHHVLMWNDTSGQARALDKKDALEGYLDYGGVGFDNPAAVYPGYAPGTIATYFPPGIGLQMFKNSDLIVQMHYAPSPTDEEDQTSINIFFKKEDATRFIYEGGLGPDALPGGVSSFVMPANKVTTFMGTQPIPYDIAVTAVFPHMHKLGQEARLFAVTSSKDTIPLINIPAWDFEWQGAYNFKFLQKIPAGSTLYYRSSYDNTTANPDNPNSPPKTLRWGFNSSDEMYLCYVFYLPYQPGDEKITQDVTAEVELGSPIEKSPIDLKGINPNPSHSDADLEFRLFSDQSMSVDMVDLNGNVVSVIEQPRIFSAGAYNLPIHSGSLSSGLYICRIHVDSKIIAVPFSVVH